MYIIKKARACDISGIAAIYDRIHDLEESGLLTTGWVRSVYPTEKTAMQALDAGDLFVMLQDETVLAAARINHEQVPEYKNAAWKYQGVPESSVMVLHMLTVDPRFSGRGLGSEFVRFYEKYALENGCHYLRMDTNEKNSAARALYSKLGYSEAGIVECNFNGIQGVKLVCLEKKI